MSNRTPIHGRTQALVALANLDFNAHSSRWPVDVLGCDGIVAAALVTGQPDQIPAEFKDTGTAWRALPRAFRAVVRNRNPAMGVYANHIACFR
jgi:hypothetical protein